MKDRLPAGGGALTGATGDLTPPDSDQEFVSGERREVEDAARHADVTAAQVRTIPSQTAAPGDPEDRPVRGPTNMAARDDGYGSGHGLNDEDPAYRMERHPSASEGDSGDRIGGRGEVDQRADHEEHM